MSIWVASQPLVNIALRSRFHWARLATSGAAFLADEGDTPSMRALRQPYPSTAPDPSIFEEESSPVDVTEAYAPPVPQISLNQRLQQRRAVEHGLPIVKLIEAGHFDQAYSLRNEYRKTHTDVRPHAGYWNAAMHSLGTWAQAADTAAPDGGAESALEKTLAWLELIPGFHTASASANLNSNAAPGLVRDAETESGVDVRPALTVLFSVPDRVSAIARFSLALASRGYATQIAHFVIPHIMRHSEPVFSQTFFEDFDRAHTAFCRVHPPPPIANTLPRSWHGIAVRSLCLAGRVEAAVEALERATSLSVHPNKFTFTLLIQELERLEAHSLLERVRAVMPTKYSVKAPHPRSASTPFTHTASTSSRTRTRTISELAQDLRLLRRQMFSISDPPSASFIAEFMLSCSEHGRLTPIYALRRRVKPTIPRNSLSTQPHSLPAYALYATSEMIYHTTRGDPTSVLLVFGRTFQPLGLPQAILDAAVADWEAERYRIRGRRTKAKQTAGLSPIPVLRLAPGGKAKADEGPKLWPSSHALAIAWQALVQWALRRHHGWKQLEALYAALLAEVPLPSTASTSSISYSTPPSTRPDAAYFNSFIIALGYRRGPERALQIIQDMRQRGVPVTLHSWTALAGCYTRNKDRDTALRILERLESSAGRELDVAEVQEMVKPDQKHSPEQQPQGPLTDPTNHHTRRLTRSRTGPIAYPNLPAPNLVTYAASLRGFVRAGMWADGREMRERMMKEGYVRGTNARVDRVLDDLEMRRGG